MANNPISVPLPADLPTDWQTSQVVSADGTSAGYTEQYGYNYLMQQVNAAQQAAEEIGESFAGLAELDADGMVPPAQMPGYAITSGVCAMGQTCPGGPLKLDDIRGNTVLGGTPAYDAPVSMESVEGPLNLHVSGKNLVWPVWNIDTQTQFGVTCTREDNGYTVSGTSTNSTGINFYIQRYDTESAFSLPAGTYTLSGMPSREGNDAFLLGLYQRLPEGTNKQIATDYGKPPRSKQTFTLSEATNNLFLSIVVGTGVNVDNVTITPQIEVGSEATAYEEPSNAIVEIPLIGVEGQTLEPLRMSYIGRYGDGNRVEAPDRVVRKDGVWCVERNAAVADLTAATWGTSANYLTPNLNGDLIRGKESHWVLCTHFPPSGANPSTVWTAGIWMGNGMAINKESLPNGTATTPEEMVQWCAAQSEAGTPVLAVYALNEPIYEELHQDVQMILNTLAVPGGVCSVWFEGDILPSGADIGLPRGDYPSAGLEGAYRWLEELSNPLPAPTGSDLYAWALEQQRGGVFATSGSTTTQNVPETGDLTGILSVTEQGSAVSMLVFGPTGKAYTAIRAAGVWRGWVGLYSEYNKPRTARPARFVIGTSTAGWTEADCDYLCDGTADDVEINAAIQALPSTGGEIVILDGTYNITATIDLNKSNCSFKISGNGPATVLKRMWDTDNFKGGVIANLRYKPTSVHIESLCVDGNRSVYSAEYNSGIYIEASHCLIKGVVCKDCFRDGITVTDCDNAVISDNICNNNGLRGIFASDISGTIHGNCCDGNQYGICIQFIKCSISGNVCKNNKFGIHSSNNDDSSFTGNTCLDNDIGLSFGSNERNVVSGNIFIRGTGLATDYSSEQETIFLGTLNLNNLFIGNIILGKNYTSNSNTSNTFVNNKFE